MEGNGNLIINVGRQLGSGGRVIAQMLAKDFNCQYYDKELLDLAAQESGFSKKIFEKTDEKQGFFHSVLRFGMPFAHDSWYGNGVSQESLFKFQSDAIKHAADQGPCVFVGRCADYILREYPNTVNVFITANIEDRIAQVREKHGYDVDKALEYIHHKESARASYYNFYTGKKWGSSESYDLCINSSILGMEATEKYIAEFIKWKMENG